jgi:ribosomal protein S18 acetylase RimI-like enzyme
MTEPSPSSPATIRVGGDLDVVFLADALREMWLDNGVHPEQIEPDYGDRVARFVAEGQREAALEFFVAEREGRRVGAACCQLYRGTYPLIVRPDTRNLGYVWGVHVAAEERRNGLGRRLTVACLEALRARGCTHAVLNAAPSGRGIYERLGFQPSNEMRLAL